MEFSKGKMKQLTSLLLLAALLVLGLIYSDRVFWGDRKSTRLNSSHA